MPDGMSGGGEPPLVHGVARLAGLAFAGASLDDLLAFIGPRPGPLAPRAAWLMDRSAAHAVSFRPDDAAEDQELALRLNRVFRVRGSGAATRLLALCAPGDLMVNTPLDFITEATDVRLDLAFLDAGGRLPTILPAHDVAFVAASESAPGMLDRVTALFDRWPRPILNDPRHAARLARERLATALRGLPGIAAPRAVRVARAPLARILDGAALDKLLPYGSFPVLLRPAHSHAGHGLMKIDGLDDLRLFLLTTRGDDFYLTQFVDYRGGDGWFRKFRVAFVDGVPFICHMAASERWMVHYLNAGMDESIAKRAAEAAEMAGFDTGFARRHRDALASLHAAVALDYYSIDCAETRDGRLLVFEADTAAIIHSMDPPDLYPYKRAPMQRCYDAFADMLARRSAARAASLAGGAQRGTGGDGTERDRGGEHRAQEQEVGTG